VLEATVAPDGTEFYFSARRPDGSTWEAEFGPETPNGQDAGVTRIDHVAIIQPWDRFDEAALFFRSVLGLTIEGGLDLPSETGLVRSRSLVSADHRIRIATNVAPLGSSRDGQFVNHVAFATDDLVASLERMSDHDIRMLRIPENYYDDLGARFGIEPETLALFRKYDVLYDSDAHGAFLHAYTAPLGDLVFELVERIDGYDGYGAVNAHVRLAAVRAQNRARQV
jgi:4-hydroxyphenylpyruvate dioxygenase